MVIAPPCFRRGARDAVYWTAPRGLPAASDNVIISSLPAADGTQALELHADRSISNPCAALINRVYSLPAVAAAQGSLSAHAFLEPVRASSLRTWSARAKARKQT